MNNWFIWLAIIIVLLTSFSCASTNKTPQHIEDAVRCKGIAYNICGKDSISLGCGKIAERECMALLGYRLKNGRITPPKNNNCVKSE